MQRVKRAHEHRPWPEWDSAVARREPDSLAEARLRLRDEIEIHEILQFLLSEQWTRLRTAAASRQIALVGDLPLYVAHDSSDVWANQGMFHLDGNGMPTVVSGVPPDYFSETGQRWGSPIYDWELMAESGFRWWRERMRHTLAHFDVVRVDHFRGIAGYWEIPAAEPTAVRGRWLEGPGNALLRAIDSEIGALPVIAEDLGVITDDVITLRGEHGLPGMRVAQFSFDDAPDSPIHDPGEFPVDVWGYSGTHDNDTTEGWFWTDNPEHDLRRVKGGRRKLLERVGGEPVGWGVVEMVAASKATTSVYPVQDLLGLGSEGRMNTPGTTNGNWRWRFEDHQLTDDLMDRLRTLTIASGRSAS